VTERISIHQDDDDSPQVCPRCAVIDVPVICPGTGPHRRSARCRHCGRVLRWLSRYTPDERQARRLAARAEAMGTRPPSPAQLEYLRWLGDLDTPPATMLAASRRIDSLLRTEVEP
jgi:hypothetical protein